ncbi:MAG: hypothetical protein NkDv07_0079 [Candidatus Improbicoccus devescovinae]|nr:MAG: hypothetical protein NkDv07_0079 [Candidatus Improbicoccus devescovinae]
MKKIIYLSFLKKYTKIFSLIFLILFMIFGDFKNLSNLIKGQILNSVSLANYNTEKITRKIVEPDIFDIAPPTTWIDGTLSFEAGDITIQFAKNASNIIGWYIEEEQADSDPLDIHPMSTGLALSNKSTLNTITIDGTSQETDFILKLNGITITAINSSGISLINNAKSIIFLEGNNKISAHNSGSSGISVNNGNVLTLTKTDDVSVGNLSVESTTYGAGIGSDRNNSCGSINLYNAEFIVKSGLYAAGIGGGQYGSGGTININNATVIASSSGFAAGIGGGYSQSTGTININNSNVVASCSDGGPGIGAENLSGGANIINIADSYVIANGTIPYADIGCGNGISSISVDEPSIFISNSSIYCVNNRMQNAKLKDSNKIVYPLYVPKNFSNILLSLDQSFQDWNVDIPIAGQSNYVLTPMSQNFKDFLINNKIYSESDIENWGFLGCAWIPENENYSSIQVKKTDGTSSYKCTSVVKAENISYQDAMDKKTNILEINLKIMDTIPIYYSELNGILIEKIKQDAADKLVYCKINQEGIWENDLVPIPVTWDWPENIDATYNREDPLGQDIIVSGDLLIPEGFSVNTGVNRPTLTIHIAKAIVGGCSESTIKVANGTPVADWSSSDNNVPESVNCWTSHEPEYESYTYSFACPVEWDWNSVKIVGQIAPESSDYEDDWYDPTLTSRQYVSVAGKLVGDSSIFNYVTPILKVEISECEIASVSPAYYPNMANGTPIAKWNEASGLPKQVTCTSEGPNQAEFTLDVVWDYSSSVPLFDPSKTDSQVVKLSGSIIPQENIINNTDNKQAELWVTVNEVTIASIDPVYIQVPTKTPIDDWASYVPAGPLRCTTSGPNVTTFNLEATWDFQSIPNGAYDPNKTSAQTIEVTGDITPIPGQVSNMYNVRPKLIVKVLEANIASIRPEYTTVSNGTTLDALKQLAPTSVYCSTDNNPPVSFYLTCVWKWDEINYDVSQTSLQQVTVIGEVVGADGMIANGGETPVPATFIITILPAEIYSIDDSYAEVPNGTQLESWGEYLPKFVNCNSAGPNFSAFYLPVVWDFIKITPAVYDPKETSRQRITVSGTVAGAKDQIENNNGVTAVLIIDVLETSVISYEAISDVNLPNGTPIDNWKSNLPTYVTAKSGEINVTSFSLEVVWDLSNISTNKFYPENTDKQTIIIYGDVTPIKDKIQNPKNIRPELSINISEANISSFKEVSITVPNGSQSTEWQLPSTITAISEGPNTTEFVLNVAWDLVSGYIPDLTEKQEIIILGSVTPIENKISNLNLLRPQCKIIVSEIEIDIVHELPVLYVKNGAPIDQWNLPTKVSISSAAPNVIQTELNVLWDVQNYDSDTVRRQDLTVFGDIHLNDSGIINPKNLRPTLNVVILESEIAYIEPTNIEVPNGTLAEDWAEFPTTVTCLSADPNQEKFDLSVIWDEKPSYDHNKTESQDIIILGTVQPIENVISNARNIRAEIKVTVAEAVIDSISVIEVSVLNGTPVDHWADLGGIPETVECTSAAPNIKTFNLPVHWDNVTGYNLESMEKQKITLYGDVIPTEGISNPNNVRATVIVNILEAKIRYIQPQVLEYENGTITDNWVLPYSVTCVGDGTFGKTFVLPVSWEILPKYDKNQKEKQEFEILGDVTLTNGITNPYNIQAKLNVIIHALYSLDLHDEPSDVIVKSKGFPTTSRLQVKTFNETDELEPGSRSEEIKQNIDNPENLDKYTIFDISVITTDAQGNETEILDFESYGEAEIWLPIPTDYDTDDLSANFITSDKDTVKPGVIETINDKNYYVFNTSHFSPYGLLDAVNPKTSNIAKNLNIFLISSLILILLISFSLIIIKEIQKKKKA